MHSVHHTDVPRCWRRLFTDVTLLMVLADLQLEPSSNPDLFYKGLVGRLDEAIVIANSPGKGRVDMCHDTIASIQEEYLPLKDPAGPSTSPAGRQFPLPLSSSLHVPRLFEPPSAMDFREWYYTKPFIINKYAADWPACANWCSPQYLRAVGGLGRKVPVETISSSGEDYTSESWTTSLMDWEEFLDALCRPPLNKNLLNQPPVEEWSGPSHYLAQHDLINQFPELRGDIIVPDYVYSGVQPPSDQFLKYHPPNVEGNLVINNWIGPKGTITPAHIDPYFNCYVQVVGKKTVWLAPTRFKEEMYPYPNTKADGQATLTIERKPANCLSETQASLILPQSTPSITPPAPAATSDPVASRSPQKPVSSSSMLSNTSRVPVFSLTSSSREKFPKFFSHVQPQAMSAVLEPGDLLFFPPGWWHAMRSEETSASVSMWF
ncbi:uncharacterized protein EI90DRAFT_3184243 [Cantharellus anzutake]|uniref:uncharacterized protein n=1 Tax=Cantharellus anzutake TaxID=1750568 RepID=UPI0019036D66|nr:uncharacterized protein EI90DRAFT_3184243 [Cantharellus anzutake]KAF8313305.1 hypothetical protein EI90DRAFT_3184243 [Cantharellus anzutake]